MFPGSSLGLNDRILTVGGHGTACQDMGESFPSTRYEKMVCNMNKIHHKTSTSFLTIRPHHPPHRRPIF
jgi:hypothetical protein